MMHAWTRLFVLIAVPLLWCAMPAQAQSLRDRLKGHTLDIRYGNSFDQKFYFHSDGRIFAYNSTYPGGEIFAPGRSKITNRYSGSTNSYEISFSGNTLIFVNNNKHTFTSPPVLSKYTYKATISDLKCTSNSMAMWTTIHGSSNRSARNCRVYKGPPK